MKAVHYDSIYEIVLTGEYELERVKISRVVSPLLDKEGVFRGLILSLEKNRSQVSPFECGIRTEYTQSHGHLGIKTLHILLGKNAYAALESQRQYEMHQADFGMLRITIT